MKVGDRVRIDGNSGAWWTVTKRLPNGKFRIERPSGAWLISPESMLVPEHPPPGKATARR
jgi:hypothetical protein